MISTDVILRPVQQQRASDRLPVDMTREGGTNRHAWQRTATLWIGIGLAFTILAGTFLRLDRLGFSQMGHTEIYVPNIHLPEDYGNPRGRLTLAKTVTNSLWEPHPPAWYVMMWGWTKVAGTGLIAIRLPSVVFGVASVVLVFVLGRFTHDALTALLASALLAVNAEQIYWSQIARPSTLVCALGLFSSLCLFLATTRTGMTRRYAFLYMLAALVGVACEHYSWFLLAGQISYCLVNARERHSAYFSLLACQALVLTLASPLVTLAIFQGGAPYLDSSAPAAIRGFLEFGFLFENSPGTTVSTAWPLAVPLVGALCFLAGLLAVDRRPSSSVSETWNGPGSGVIGVAMLLSSAAILAMAKVLGAYMPARRFSLTATAVLPVVFFVLAWLVRTHAGAILKAGERLRLVRILPQRLASITAVMAIVPFGLAVAASQFKPLLATRHLLIMVPYLLVVMSYGLTRLLTWKPRVASRALFASALVAVALVHVSSLRALERDRSRQDYRGLASTWKPHIQRSDLILMRDHFRLTPIFYYRKPRDNQIVGRNHAAEVTKRSPERIWVPTIPEFSRASAIDDALVGYERTDSVNARDIGVELYVRRP